ncbi:MAG TPA: radical SAM protein, partial [Candidatus Acidoferrum sp.]|nr:radical SAM protein [Candidatus Acidoferrum sp.]
MKTLEGRQIPPIGRSLPRTIRSLCPECLQTIPAEEVIEDGRVIMRKSCPAHGSFRDIVFSDAGMFLRMEAWHFGDGQGFANPAGDVEGECPQRCGICGWHTSHTSLANVDLTSRCNLACPICFADANRRAYELTFDQAEATLRRLRAQRPAPAFAVQFTGGEPTVHPRFLDIVASAKTLGFSHIQVASNGLALADPDFACRARDAGLQYVYLQMDGTTDDVFRKIRGTALLDKKLAVLQAARKAGLRVIFVPTILTGVNDHQIGDLFRLAFEHLDVLSGISFQPMTFTGRMPEGDRLRLRFTLSDLAREFSLQTGITHPQDDWFPLSSAVPLIRYAGALSGAALVNHTCHPHCGLMTLLFVDQDRRATPITRFLD